MATRDLNIYYERWVALDGLIKSAIETYRNSDHFPRQGTILKLLCSLREFAAGQFQFFYFGFGPEKPPRLPGDPILEMSNDFPPEDILTGIIDQIGHDLALIQQVADDRLLAQLTANSTVINALDAADKLTWLALQPAIHHQIVDAPEIVLTYFEKSAGFYSIPYEKLALVAVPFTCTMPGNHQDYLAIPHEAGHYVYRHLNSPAKKALIDTAATFKISERYLGWIRAVFEEMCADIYGCLIAGPVMAMDFEKLSLGNSQANFCEGDDKHPNPALRPLIYCQVLGNPTVRRLTKDNWSSIARKLAKQWTKELGLRKVDYFVVKRNSIQGRNQITKVQHFKIARNLNPVPSATSAGRYGPLGKGIDLVITALSQYLIGTGQMPAPHDLPGWAGKVDSKTKPDGLFPKFEKWFEIMLPRIKHQDNAAPDPALLPDPDFPPNHFPPVLKLPPELGLPDPPLARDPNDHTPELWLNWAERENPTITLQPPAGPIPSGEVKDPSKMKPGTWGHILWANGWTTEGPSDHYMPPLL